MTWGEVIRRLKAAGFVEVRCGKDISVVGVAALVGAGRSAAKAHASRANGRLGGRPRKSPSGRAARAKASR